MHSAIYDIVIGVPKYDFEHYFVYCSPFLLSPSQSQYEEQRRTDVCTRLSSCLSPCLEHLRVCLFVCFGDSHLDLDKGIFGELLTPLITIFILRKRKKTESNPQTEHHPRRKTFTQGDSNTCSLIYPSSLALSHTHTQSNTHTHAGNHPPFLSHVEQSALLLSLYGVEPVCL